MYRPRASLAFKRPGVSINTSWVSPLVRTPVIRVRVVWGFWVTMATFSPTRRFRRLLLPALGLPTRAIKAVRVLLISILPSAGYPGHGVGHIPGQSQPLQHFLFLFPHQGSGKAPRLVVVP